MRGARPIVDPIVTEIYKNFSYHEVTLEQYSIAWKTWLTNSSNKQLLGIENFPYFDFTNGTSQTFDNFILKYSATRTIVVLPGEFQYHKCIGRHQKLVTSETVSENQALIMSVPFSDYGSVHPNFNKILKKCNELNIPVCLDLAYWGISKNINLDLTQYPCVTEITSSLSKPFHTLENHRVGIRFTRNYENDGISMINEVGMQNKYSMSIGCYYMERLSCDFMWNKYSQKYYGVCANLRLKNTNTVIFGLGDCSYSKYNRGILNNNRVCISENLI